VKFHFAYLEVLCVFGIFLPFFYFIGRFHNIFDQNKGTEVMEPIIVVYLKFKGANTNTSSMSANYFYAQANI